MDMYIVYSYTIGYIYIYIYIYMKSRSSTRSRELRARKGFKDFISIVAFQLQRGKITNLFTFFLIIKIVLLFIRCMAVHGFIGVLHTRGHIVLCAKSGVLYTCMIRCVVLYIYNFVCEMAQPDGYNKKNTTTRGSFLH